MKKPLLIIIFLLLVGIGIAFFVKFPKHHTTNTQVQETSLSGNNEVIQSGDNQELTGNTITTGDENPLVYTNTEFGFQLTLPEGWEDYRAFIYDMEGNGYNSGFVAGIVIALPTNSPRPGVQDPNDPNRFIPGYTGQYQDISGYALMIGVAVWLPELYEEYKCENNIEGGCINSSELLGKNEKYNYQLIGPHDFPDDIMNIWGNRNYFQQIIPTFKVL